MIIEPANRLSSVQEYYFSRKLAEIRAMNEAGEDVINLGIGNPDLLPPNQATEKLKGVINTPGINGYQSYKGIPELRKSISDWMKKVYGVDCHPETDILPLIGSKEGIFHISMAFLNSGDKVLVPNPGYPTYTSVSELVGAETITYNLKGSNNWQIDFDELQKIPLNKVKLVWLNSPHMPTGVEYAKADMERLIDIARVNKFLIVNDNPYSFILNEQPKSLLQIRGSEEVLLELNSISKTFHMPGWRIGWLSGKKDYIETILKVKSNIDSGMFKALQVAACEVLGNTSKDWHKKQNKVYSNRKIKAFELLNSISCTYSETQKGMFIWAKIPGQNSSNSIEFSEKMLKETRVFIPPGDIFGSQGKGYIRLSLCVPEQRMLEAQERLKQL